MSAASLDKAHAPAPPPSGGVRTDVAIGVLAAALAVAVAATALAVSPRFFLTDDYATYFMPGFREIARLLAHGQFPLLTDRIWSGGALLQEYQYAVFNPVSLALYAGIGQLNDLALAAAIYSLVHVAVLGGGAYFLARVLGCARRHAFLVAVLAPLSDWIFFWGAADWIPALVSMAWLAWAWAFLILTYKRPNWAPAAAAMTAMTLLSGWPFTNLALLLSALVAGRVLFANKHEGRLRAAAWPTLALAAGGLIAMPAILPVQLYVAYAQRPVVAGMWATDLTGLLEFGMPFVQTHWGAFHHPYETVVRPLTFAAWFAPLALASANWRRLAANPAAVIVMVSAVAFAALSMISHIGPFRWMFRLLPYYQLAILMLAGLALTQADEDGAPWKFDRLALVIAAEVWLAIGQTRERALVYLAVAYAFGALAWLSTRFKTRRDLRWTALALVSSIALFWLSLWSVFLGGYPRYPNNWTTMGSAPTAVAGLSETPMRYAIFSPFEADPGAPFWKTYGPANTALQWPGGSLIGYSSMTSEAFVDHFCQIGFGTDCDDIVARVTKPVTPTGRGLIDLMGVDEVDVQREADAKAFAAAGSGWSQARGPIGEWRFSRIKPQGLVTWASPGAAGAVVSSAPARIVLQANNDSPAPGTLVVARAWYPTWQASLDGRPVRARALDGVLVAVDLPPNSRGRLTLSFWPTGLTAGLVLAAFGIALLAITAWFPRLVDGPAAWIEGLLARRAHAAGPKPA